MKVTCKGFAFLLCAAFMLIGCQQAKVKSYSDPGYDMHSVDSYAWLPNGSAVYGVVPQNQALLKQTLKLSIDENLQARGWRPVSAEISDVLVRFVVGAESQFEVERTGVSHVAGQESEVPVEVRKIRSGKFAIDLIDTGTGRIVWRGVTDATREGVPDKDELAKYLRRGVQAIFARLP
jgi:Domain of unknown function (DUF4136)